MHTDYLACLYCIRPVARIFQRGLHGYLITSMHAQECKTIGGSGACSPRKFSEIRCPEIASEAILGQKQPY